MAGCSGKFCVVWSMNSQPQFMETQDDDSDEPRVSLFETYEEAEEIANKAFAADVFPFAIVELA